MAKIPLSIYIHVPFCRRRCVYCDFLSFSGMEWLIESYVAALLADIAEHSAEFRDYEVITIFFGGGTPSLLKSEHFEAILREIRTNFHLSQSCPISMEANPETVDEAYLLNLRNLGMSRISFGVQSFSNKNLKTLGRLHRADTAINAVKSASNAGFEDINADLIFALPNQSLADFEKDLDAALELPITHISCYALTVEEGTPLADSPLAAALPDEAADRAMYALAKQKLAAAGFAHYEISNWARAGFECRHNLGYWTGRQYLGLGLGASSYFGNRRLKKTDDLKAYIGGNFNLVLLEELSPQAQMSEFVMLGLRLTSGISIADFQTRFGQNIFDIFGQTLNKFLAEGLLQQNTNKITLTEKGIDLSNMIFSEFLE
ncbi:MAG: radical SAM family heme chaperone HemW [Clostridiales bacterium]|jgi:oxygen-independent coproporphyrinogen-3 oxidase|nr:radical SAM family heme chaperone HemW [Clostridiales bacterium]